MDSAGTVRLPPAHCTCTRANPRGIGTARRVRDARGERLQQSVTNGGRCARGSAEPRTSRGAVRERSRRYFTASAPTRRIGVCSQALIDVRLRRALGNLPPLSFAVAQAHLLFADDACEKFLRAALFQRARKRLLVAARRARSNVDARLLYGRLDLRHRCSNRTLRAMRRRRTWRPTASATPPRRSPRFARDALPAPSGVPSATTDRRPPGRPAAAPEETPGPRVPGLSANFRSWARAAAGRHGPSRAPMPWARRRAAASGRPSRPGSGRPPPCAVTAQSTARPRAGAREFSPSTGDVRTIRSTTRCFRAEAAAAPLRCRRTLARARERPRAIAAQPLGARLRLAAESALQHTERGKRHGIPVLPGATLQPCPRVRRSGWPRPTGHSWGSNFRARRGRGRAARLRPRRSAPGELLSRRRKTSGLRPLRCCARGRS